MANVAPLQPKDASCFGCLCRSRSVSRRRRHAVLRAASEFPARHLVIMVNGIVGSASNWKFAADQFCSRFGSEVLVHCSARNSSTLTFDGVDVMGHRLAEEVKEVIETSPGLQKISFVAHSLGGLIARYAIGQLYVPPKSTCAGNELVEVAAPESLKSTCAHNGEEQEVAPESQRSTCINSKEEQQEAHESPKTTCTSNLETREKVAEPEPSKGTIFGLQPVNFITVATPHLGIRGNWQLPFLCGFTTLEKVAVFIAHWFVGRTGKHLFLSDEDESKTTLLRRMVSDCSEGLFISALQAFRRRVAYANMNYDRILCSLAYYGS